MHPIFNDMTADAPPDALNPPLAALWWLRKGGLALGPAWERAHQICQSREGEPFHDMVHALCHSIEGEAANAAYWYRRAGRKPEADITAEWDWLASHLPR